MSDLRFSDADDDPYDLARFVAAQETTYDQALTELRAGRKRSHWMWFVFPQYDGLGVSTTSRFFAIKSAAEAEAYLRHPVLGRRLLECVDAVLGVGDCSAHDIFGSPDDMKLQSSATLFGELSSAGSPFERVLAKYFAGERDRRTLQLLRSGQV